MAKRANPGAAPSYAALPSVDARARNESGFQKYVCELQMIILATIAARMLA